MDSGTRRAEVVVGFSESAEHQSQRAAFIDDGVMLYGQSQSGQVETVGIASSGSNHDWLFNA
jgi:hypothetical protein